MIKANKILISAAAFLLSVAPSLVSGQIIVNGGGRLIINNGGGGAIIVNNGGVITYDSRPQDTTVPVAPVGDLLRLRDGSILHGKLSQIQTGMVVHWQHPDVSKDIEFNSDSLDFIQLSPTAPLKTEAGCRLRLANGDELLATLNSIDSATVDVTTSFSGDTKIPRSAIESITLLSTNYSVSYEGPNDLEGWKVNPVNAWWYRDGTLVSHGNGVLSRDLGTRDSSTVDFDLASPGLFVFMVDLYTDKDQFDFVGGCYGITFGPENIELRRGQLAPGSSAFGKATWPTNVHKTKRHITIQSNKAQKSIAVFVDHQLVKRWEDKNGFGGTGSRVLLGDMSGRAGLVLSNFRITLWNGAEPEITRGSQTNAEAVTFLNRDRANGKITGFSDGKLALDLGKRQLNVPIERVTQITFPASAAPQRAPREVRVALACFGQISFQLDNWDANHISGHSDIFGAVQFPSQAVRQIDFNLNAPKTETVVENADEFGGLDE